MRLKSSSDGGVPFLPAFMCIILLVSGVVSFVVFPLLKSPHLVQTRDGLLHTAIVNSIQHYGVPPRTLYFHDEPILYHWMGDCLLLGLGHVASSSMYVFDCWKQISVSAALLFVAAAYWLVRTLGLNRTGAVFVSTVVFFSVLAPFAVVFYVNGAAWADIYDTYDLTRIASWHWDGRISLSKFYDPNTFIFSFSLSFMLLVGLLRLLRASRLSFLSKRYGQAAFLVFAAGIGLQAVNVIVGMAIPVLSAGSFLLLLAFRCLSVKRWCARSIRFFMPIFVLLLADVCILRVYVSSPGAVEQRIRFPFSALWQFNWNMVGGALFPLGLAYFFGLLVLVKYRFLRLRSTGSTSILFILLIAFGCCLLNFIRLPGENQYKLMLTASQFSVCAACVLFIKTYRKVDVVALRFVAMVVLLFMTFNAVAYAWTYSEVRNPGGSVPFQPEEYEVAQWIMACTDEEAVFLEYVSRPESVVATLARRPSYFGFLSTLWLHGYDRTEIDRRRHVISLVGQTKDLTRIRLEHIDYLLSEEHGPCEYPLYKNCIVYDQKPYRIYDLRKIDVKSQP